MTPIIGTQSSSTPKDAEISHTHIIGHAHDGVTIIREYDHAHPDGDTHHTHARLAATDIDEAFVTVPVNVGPDDVSTEPSEDPYAGTWYKPGNEPAA